MNERIQELWRDCVLQYTNNPMNWQTVADEFAELIIKDCLAQVDKVDQMLDNPAEKTGAAWVGLAIAKHFGVE